MLFISPLLQHASLPLNVLSSALINLPLLSLPQPPLNDLGSLHSKYVHSFTHSHLHTPTHLHTTYTPHHTLHTLLHTLHNSSHTPHTSHTPTHSPTLHNSSHPPHSTPSHTPPHPHTLCHATSTQSPTPLIMISKNIYLTFIQGETTKRAMIYSADRENGIPALLEDTRYFFPPPLFHIFFTQFPLHPSFHILLLSSPLF
jgi:hypothetical protein